MQHTQSQLYSCNAKRGRLHNCIATKAHCNTCTQTEKHTSPHSIASTEVFTDACNAECHQASRPREVSPYLGRNATPLKAATVDPIESVDDAWRAPLFGCEHTILNGGAFAKGCGLCYINSAIVVGATSNCGYKMCRMHRRACHALQSVPTQHVGNTWATRGYHVAET